MPELREIPPERRNGSPRWEVWQDGVKLGIIRQKKLGGAVNPFYEAIARHPRTGRPLSLELHTDRDDRVEVLVRIHADPSEFRQHWS